MPHIKRKRIERRTSFYRENPINPFFVFLKEFREDLRREDKRMSGKQSACAAGTRWREMSWDEKLLYRTWAAKNRQQKLEADLLNHNTPKEHFVVPSYIN